MTDCCSNSARTRRLSALSFVVDIIMEALSRQKVQLPIQEEIKELTYHEKDFADKLAQARRLRSQGIPVVLLPQEDAK